MVKRQYYSLNGNKVVRVNMIGNNSLESKTTCSHGFVGVVYLAKLQISECPPSPKLRPLSHEVIRLNLPVIRPGPAYVHTLRKNLSLKYLPEFYLTQCFDDLHI